jgi:hypothetical protein
MALRSSHVSTKSILLVLCCLLGFSGPTDARGDQEPAAPEEGPVVGPAWKDASTGEILFTIDDVLAFDWEDQIFVLDLDAALGFLAWMVPHKYLSRELLLKDEEGLIYQGRWVSPISSVAFFGPVYECGEPAELFGYSQAFRIVDGYPDFATEGPDPGDARYAPRLYAALEDRNLLCDFDPNEGFVGFDIDCVRVVWHECDPGLKIRVEFFPDTFSVDHDARAHVFFSGDPCECLPDIDFLRIDIKFVADKGQYRSDVQIDDIPAEKVVSDGIYVCRFGPWTPCPGSRPTVEESGTAYVSLSVLLCRRTESEVEIVRRLDFPEQTVCVRVPLARAEAGGE